ncbi:hypothetical protein EUX98_g7525 [Antrodiella citrinella]|uniref:Cytochrome P450 n=1 Tax=Antrodiella citrinella TaxID=2447956 RepID=A0A4S4MNN8_9APHY|nr:hypothetical protein EUX98_g7525 [Antrodiella citrinella]
MLNDLMGYDWAISLMPYNDKWRRHRSTFHQYFGARAAESFKEHFVKHIRQATSATIMKVTYGFDVKDEHANEWVELIEHALVGFSIIEGHLGNGLSILYQCYIPSWFPGANFHRVAAHYKRLATRMSVEPFEAVKSGIRAGTAGPSASASMIENLPDGPVRQKEEEICRNSAAVAYGAGTDITTAALVIFALAMTLHPEVQKKEAELDAIVGSSRLPSFDDRDSLPYIEAVMKEILRWLVTPLGRSLLVLD